MVALLTILALGLMMGKLARRMTPAADLLLLFLIAGVVLVEFISWGPQGTGSNLLDLARKLLSDR